MTSSKQRNGAKAFTVAIMRRTECNTEPRTDETFSQAQMLSIYLTLLVDKLFQHFP